MPDDRAVSRRESAHHGRELLGDGGTFLVGKRCRSVHGRTEREGFAALLEELLGLLDQRNEVASHASLVAPQQMIP